jgi:hypothetical protein
MATASNLDHVRAAALDRIDRSERGYRRAIFAGFVAEAALLLAFVFLADFNNRLHLLLMIATVGIYTILALGLVALGAHVSRNTQLILRALDAH